MNLNQTYVNKNFSGVSIDSRNITQGQLFVAIQGEQYDGHDFVENAFQQGATAAIVSQAFFDKCSNLGYKQKLIPVADTQMALRELAATYRDSLSLPVVALTGSCGKTSTKEMIASILREQCRVFVTPGNKNNYLGVPLSLLACSPEDEMAIFELGANHMGEIRENVHLVKPKIALITNVGSAHIGEFGGVEAIFTAKSEIYEALEADGVAIYNADDIFAGRWKTLLAHQDISTLTFGLSKDANIRADVDEIAYNDLMCGIFTLHTRKGSIGIQLSVPGEHNILNALAAAAVAMTLGVSLENIASGLNKYTGFSGRMIYKKGIHGCRVIDDTYNANLKSVEAAMQVLAGFSGRRFLVLGDISELGKWGVEHHQLIGVKAAELGLDALFTCGTLSLHAGEAFVRATYGDGVHWHFETTKELAEMLQSYLDSDATLVVKGSRSSHMEDVVSAIIVEDKS